MISIEDAMKLSAVVLASTLVLASISFAEECQYGVIAFGGECRNVEKLALGRVAAAKSICYSANSGVQWSKNNKEPVGAFSAMRGGARIAMKGFTQLDSCERSDLVVKIDYDAAPPEQVTLAVTDAESGEKVFQEERNVSDLSSDLMRMAMHFQNMRSDALANKAAETAAVKSRERRQAFFALLPKHWRNAEGLAVDVWVTNGILYEASSQTTAGSIKLEASCEVKQGADEVTPWSGFCTYTFIWPNWSRPICTLQTQEIVTSISAHEISGQSQRLDTSPLQHIPPTCPEAAMAKRDFRLTPEENQDAR